MSERATRFRPPALALDETTRWVLRRAFGPVDGEVTLSLSSEQVVETAGRLGIAARIGQRVPEDRLLRELDEDATTALRRQTRRALEAALAYDALVAGIAEKAATAGAPLVLLKGYALHAGGYAAPGSRQVGDLDVLVERPAAAPLHAALRAAGFRPAPGMSNEQHLPPLAAPGWGIVDLHFAVRGVADASGAWLEAPAVLSFGAPSEVAPGCVVPDRTLLAAHALAHGIEQHSISPLPYPLLKMIADLVDLLPTERAWEEARSPLEESLGATLLRGEIGAARALTLGLAAGAPPEELPAPARELLAHLLAYSLAAGYRNSLRRRHFWHRLRQARERGTLLRYARRKLLDLWRRAAGGS